MLGMLLPEDERFLWIAEESLLAPLPEGEPLFRMQTQRVALGGLFDAGNTIYEVIQPGLHQHPLHRCSIPLMRGCRGVSG